MGEVWAGEVSLTDSEEGETEGEERSGDCGEHSPRLLRSPWMVSTYLFSITNGRQKHSYLI